MRVRQESWVGEPGDHVLECCPATMARWRLREWLDCRAAGVSVIADSIRLLKYDIQFWRWLRRGRESKEYAEKYEQYFGFVYGYVAGPDEEISLTNYFVAISRQGPTELAALHDALRSTNADLAYFLGTAIASGVVGNFSYDAIKYMVRKLRAKRRDTPYALALAASFIALQAECIGRGIPEPQITDILPNAEKGREGTWSIALRANDLLATVTIPGGDLSKIAVKIVDP
jgi:hypothetical protein